MIMKIAIAKEGFIDTNPNPNMTGKTTFLECLQEILPFTEVDLMEFDGNSFQMINSYDPTNSVFIYTNQQGTFLYTITSATPRVHKNNMIWDCLCYKMEDVAEIESVLGNNKIAQAIIYKNILPSGFVFDTTGSTLDKAKLPEIVITEKDNFKVQEIYKAHISSDYWCYKLKFLVNPTSDNSLVSKEEDGSFNFFFPFYVSKPAKTTDWLFPLGTPTDTIKDHDTNTTLTMAQIIKKYSTNLKSVELIPFFPYEDGILGGTLTLSDSSNVVDVITQSGAVFTDAGIFFPYGHTTKRSARNGLYIYDYDGVITSLSAGGGVRGKIILPIGEVPVDFNSFKFSTKDNGADDYTEKGQVLYGYIKSEGWKVDGMFEADVPPHYLNFYTDETGQLFISNMTTNAQELRQLNRETENKRAQVRMDALSNIVGGGVTSLKNINFGGILGGVLEAGQTLGFGLERTERDYNLAKANYEDKIATQGLLASMTGKTISGNVLASDLIINLSKRNFLFILEMNYCLQRKYVAPNGSHYILPQKDYDYSTQYLINKSTNAGTSEEGKYNLVINKTSGINTTYEYDTIPNFMLALFGFGTASGNKIYYKDRFGLNYNITFELANLPTQLQNPHTDITETLKTTLVLNFPVRHIKKYFS